MTPSGPGLLAAPRQKRGDAFLHPSGPRGFGSSMTGRGRGRRCWREGALREARSVHRQASRSEQLSQGRSGGLGTGAALEAQGPGLAGEGTAQALSALDSGAGAQRAARAGLGDREPVWLPAHAPAPWEPWAHPSQLQNRWASALTSRSGSSSASSHAAPPRLLPQLPTPGLVGGLPGRASQTHVHRRGSA